MKKLIELLKKIWKDSVVGNLLSALILALLSVLYNFFLSLTSDTNFVTVFTDFWNQNIKLWKALCGLLVVLISISLIQKIRNKRKDKFRYDNDTLTLDKELYKKISKKILTQGMILDLRNQTFSSHSFPVEKLDWINCIIEENKKSDFEFYHPDIEILKNRMIAEIQNFDSVLDHNIFGAGQNGWVGIPREWEIEKFYEAANTISGCEKAICEKYDDFVKACRNILKV
jgi:hypothetical protein